MRRAWGVVKLLTIVMALAAGTALAAGEALMHNSNNLGEFYGNWGVVGGRYGEFTCATCHSKTTDNIKLVAGTITAPLGSWSSSKTPAVQVIFNNMTAFGNDAGGHATSTHIFEVCHSQTTVHKYNTAGQIDLDHQGANLTDCTVCHSHENGFKAKDCISCHGGTAYSGNPMRTNMHAAHMDNDDGLDINFDCIDCHAKTVKDDITIKLAPNSHRNGVFGDFSGSRAGGSYVAGVCANVYCHTNGKGAPPATAVNWLTGPSLSCKSCHGGLGSYYGEPMYANDGPGAANANSHPKHVGASGAGQTCQNCHGFTMDGTGFNGGGNHTNRIIDVIASNFKSFAYDADSKTCSNISCHSGNGMFIPVDVQWGAAMPSDCSGCHGGNAAATTKMTSNYHTAHINNASVLGANLGCVDCHANTVSSDRFISTSANHLNGLANFSGAKSGKNKTSCQAAYCHSSGKGVAGTAVNWTTAGTTLDCKGCHGGGTSQAGEPVYASGAAGSFTANSHPKHAGTTGADAACQNCHGTTMSGTALTATGVHLNKTIDVVQGNSKTFGYISGTKTCSNISCHGGPGKTAQWGATLDCAGCHPTLSNAHNRHVGTISLASINGFDNFTANRSAGVGSGPTTAYGFGCANCHPVTESASHMNGAVDVVLSPGPGAGTLKNKNTNGSDNGSYNGDKTCDVVYCHGDGKSALVIGANGKAPAWNGSFANTTDRCANCHGNQPTTSAHVAHAVGIHYDNTFSGTSGKLPSTGAQAVNAAHGAGNRATTINCNICHSATITVSCNDKNTLCISCHATNVKGNAELANLAMHVNGNKNIQFADVTIATKAQVGESAFNSYTAAMEGGWSRNRGYKNFTSSYDVTKTTLFSTASFSAGDCSNVACHAGKPVKWTDTISCNNCHSRL